MKARPKSAKSPFEIAFETQQTFNRNKQFLDISKTVFLDRQYSALRRAPIKTDTNHISEKINSSFMNTTAELTEKTQRNITCHKSRKSSHTIMQSHISSDVNQPEDHEQSQIKEEFNRTPRGRSFSIEKMTSRDYHHRLKNKAVSDERRFNNFQKFKPGVPLYCSYDNSVDKKDQIGPYLQLQYNTHKLYEQYYYRRTTNNCRVDYHSQKKLNHDRIYFNTKRPQNICATDSNPQKIVEALKKVQGNNKFNAMTQFYRNTGRELPCQMEMRDMNQLTNYWKNQTGRIQRKKQDYQSRKIKQELSNKRVNKIKYSKDQEHISHRRGDVCDELYFRRFKF